MNELVVGDDADFIVRQNVQAFLEPFETDLLVHAV